MEIVLNLISKSTKSHKPSVLWELKSFCWTGLKKGIEQGEENGRIEFVKSLLRETSFDTDKITPLVGVSPGFVGRKNKKWV